MGYQCHMLNFIYCYNFYIVSLCKIRVYFRSLEYRFKIYLIPHGDLVISNYRLRPIPTLSICCWPTASRFRILNMFKVRQHP